MSNEGIVAQVSAPYSKEQNGGAEKAGHIIMVKATALRLSANFPESLWTECFMAAIYIINRIPTQALNWKAPIEAIQTSRGQPNPVPKLQHIVGYSSRAYPLIQNQPKLNKVHPRALIGYLCGYEGTNNFRIWVPSQQKVIISRDVTFDESLKYRPEDDKYIDAQVVQAIERPVFTVIEDSEEVNNLDIISVFDTLRYPEIPSGSKQPNKPSGQLLTLEPTLSLPDMEGPASERNGRSTPNSQEGNPSITSNIPGPSGQSVGGTKSPDPAPLFPSAEAPENQLLAEQLTSESYKWGKGKYHYKEIPESNKPHYASTMLNESNIQKGKRARAPRKQAYLAQLASVVCSQNTLLNIAFSTALAFNKQRIYRTELPEKPERWKDMLQHPYSTEFIAAANKEYGTLNQRKTFEEAEVLDAKGHFIIPLI